LVRSRRGVALDVNIGGVTIDLNSHAPGGGDGAASIKA
jgi:hypothetical protein